MPLKNSFFISFALHLALFGAPLFTYDMVTRQDLPKKPLVVDYVIVKEREVRPSTSFNRDLALNKRIEMKAPAEANWENTKSAASKDATLRDAKKQARIRSGKDYINYFQFLREKIRQRLKVNYTNLGKEGDVSLIFILNSNGSLSAIEINDQASVPDKDLRDIAIESVKEAAPFPGFPKALPYPRMSFNLDISFKKK